MTRDITPDIQTIRLFLTEAHPCSYLPNKNATTAFVDPNLNMNNQLYSRLSRLGFRRSGKYLYIPRCQECTACIPLRIIADQQKPNKQQKRCLKANADLTIDYKTSIDSDEHYPLYESYISQRHKDGDMYPPSLGQFNDFINQIWPHSEIIEFKLNQKLIAATLIDVLDDGISAIYTYYAPELDKRSLGTFAILTAVEKARQLQLPYVYLGYWIQQCNKMSYKSRFKPSECLIGEHWEINT